MQLEKSDIQCIYLWDGFQTPAPVFWRIANGKGSHHSCNLLLIFWAAHAELIFEWPFRNEGFLTKGPRDFSSPTVQISSWRDASRLPACSACRNSSFTRYFCKLINTPSSCRLAGRSPDLVFWVFWTLPQEIKQGISFLRIITMYKYCVSISATLRWGFCLVRLVRLLFAQHAFWNEENLLLKQSQQWNS